MMPISVKIDFPADFESKPGDMAYIHLGRLYVGPHVVRMVLCSDGETRLYVRRSAVVDGHVVLVGEQADDEMPVFGLGA